MLFNHKSWILAILAKHTLNKHQIQLPGFPPTNLFLSTLLIPAFGSTHPCRRSTAPWFFFAQPPSSKNARHFWLILIFGSLVSKNPWAAFLCKKFPILSFPVYIWVLFRSEPLFVSPFLREETHRSKRCVCQTDNVSEGQPGNNSGHKYTVCFNF